MDEATAVPSWPQMGVFLCTGHLDAPHRLPGLIELAVNWVNPRVVWSHGIAHICWDTMLLERRGCGVKTECQQMNRWKGRRGKRVKRKLSSGEQSREVMKQIHICTCVLMV